MEKLHVNQHIVDYLYKQRIKNKTDNDLLTIKLPNKVIIKIYQDIITKKIIIGVIYDDLVIQQSTVERLFTHFKRVDYSRKELNDLTVMHMKALDKINPKWLYDKSNSRINFYGCHTEEYRFIESVIQKAIHNGLETTEYDYVCMHVIYLYLHEIACSINNGYTTINLNEDEFSEFYLLLLDIQTFEIN